MHRTASYTPSKPEHPHKGSAIVFVSTEKAMKRQEKMREVCMSRCTVL